MKEMETKRCSKCEERKPISEFYKKGFNKQGIQQYDSRCRQCQAEYKAKYYASIQVLKKNCQSRAGGQKSLQTQAKNESSQANLARQA